MTKHFLLAFFMSVTCNAVTIKKRINNSCNMEWTAVNFGDCPIRYSMNGRYFMFFRNSLYCGDAYIYFCKAAWYNDFACTEMCAGRLADRAIPCDINSFTIARSGMKAVYTGILRSLKNVT